jgi:hypothetical protein
MKRGHIEQKNMKRTTDSTFNEIKESVKHNANLMEKCKKKSDSTSLLAICFSRLVIVSFNFVFAFLVEFSWFCTLFKRSFCLLKSDSTSLLAYDLKMRLDSEPSRITNITDSRATGICSLKTRVQVIGEC